MNPICTADIILPKNDISASVCSGLQKVHNGSEVMSAIPDWE
jgi:hypothetical protein